MTADLLSPRAQGAKDEPSPPISIVVAVAVRLYRDGLARMLGDHRHRRLAGSAATAAEAEAAVLALRPDAVVIDVTVGDVFGLMRTLRAEQLDTRIPASPSRRGFEHPDLCRSGGGRLRDGERSMTDLVRAIDSTAAMSMAA